MESHERAAESCAESEKRSDDGKILVLSRHLNRNRPSTSIAGAGLSEADIIRGVTRNLMLDALDVLEKMRDDCQRTPDLRENYSQLYHYLDYLKRFCEGRV